MRRILFIDYEALVAAFGDHIYAVVGRDRKHKLSATYLYQLDLRGYFEARRRGGFVTHVDVGANGLFFRPFQMGVRCFDAGSLL